MAQCCALFQIVLLGFWKDFDAWNMMNKSAILKVSSKYVIYMTKN